MSFEWLFPFGVSDTLAVIFHIVIIGLTVIITVKSAHQIAADRDLGWRLFALPMILGGLSLVTIMASVAPGSGLGIMAHVIIAGLSMLGVVTYLMIAKSRVNEP